MFARHIVANFLNFLIVLLLIISIVVIWGKAQFNSPGQLQQAVEFSVETNDRLSSSKNYIGVADRLFKRGIISNAIIFRIAARYLKAENDLKIGDYEIPPHASMMQVLQIIRSGVSASHMVTIPEGFTSFQIVERLKAIKELSGDIIILPDEGSLSPNTYQFNRNNDRQSLIDRMRAAQTSILQAAWHSRAENLPLKTKEEALILASIIEKETGIKSERHQVAAVFINRLRRGMKLQTDPTVIYGLTKGEKTLGRGLRRSELAKKTPYNTYIIHGLPPTPIAHPGKEAIEAALNPSQSDNLYFVADGSGGHLFAKTLHEHNRNVAKWRAIEKKRKNTPQEKQ